MIREMNSGDFKCMSIVFVWISGLQRQSMAIYWCFWFISAFLVNASFFVTLELWWIVILVVIVTLS